MARSLASLILLLFAAAGISSAQDQTGTKPCGRGEAPAGAPDVAGPAPSAAKPENGRNGGGPRKSRTFPGGAVDAEKAKEAFRNMSPDERERWLRKFRDWADMPAEKKKSLADREEFFRRKMREGVEAAQNELGIELNEEQKKVFAQRYMEERRKVEEELRREMDESRKPKLKAMVEKLRQEFATRPTAPQ